MNTPPDTAITIITVVRNSVCSIEDTILSVINQPSDTIDYIVIDGASTDGTLDVLNRYRDQITTLVSEKDAGIYDAMNKGWALAAENSFILYLGAGDRLLSLPTNMHTFSSDEIIYGDVYLNSNTIFRSRADWHLKFYNTLHHQALMIHKSKHIDPPFDLTYGKYADFDFNQRLFKQKNKFIYDRMFCSYASPGGVTAQYDLEESLKVVNKNFGLFWFVTYLACKLIEIAPYFKRFRPIKDSNSSML